VNGTHFELSGSGTLDGAGTLAANGSFDWLAGSISGTGILLIPAGGTVTISGPRNPSLQQRTVHIPGDSTRSGGGDINSGVGAIINIQSGGSFDIQNDQNLAHNLGGTPLQFNVLAGGSLTKSAGTGITMFNGPSVSNAGTVNAKSGTLNFSSYSQSAG